MPADANYRSLGYRHLWDTAKIVPSREVFVKSAASTAVVNKARYEKISEQVRAPWFVIAVLHMRESSFSFTRHMHNGDPLKARTVQVPKGRPKSGSPPFTFEESCIDALARPPHDLTKVAVWDIERMLYEIEKYNGWGYRGRCNSPYLWAGTQHYRGGKYVADHKFDPTFYDTQLGCVAVIKAIAEKDPTVAKALERMSSGHGVLQIEEAIKQEGDEATKGVRQVRNGVAATTVATSTTTALEQTNAVPKTEFPYWPIATALGLAVLTISVIVIVKRKRDKANEVLDHWLGNVQEINHDVKV